ncbi:DUF647-domain-containing protein [Trametes versicolor FP-101664 SS1]|uniref:DUF647-domain-containing protein n=1 Tax=Trametes versicolor (strain FP-101664) TaxID=717944 RepID=R7S6V9_TRAVS|nr:DUF647-domain-containing protein [Trametes versicolor FP-101664 SS1]EIW51641.1 DUF647-domain-containing protein [Trametes versicolor FP-101664 SS1]
MVLHQSSPYLISQTNAGRHWRRLLNDVFLPEGYPFTVSPQCVRYQIWNAVQAFCSSLAGLFASRAVLQGHGVGNASASATDAIFLTILQDVFSRLTTIVSGYYLGTSLYPEAKTYRLLADILNDAAMVTDTLSPHLAHFSFSLSYPFVVPASNSSLRVVALCMSGAFRALCGAVAGGSKAALTVHFATAGERPGDVGDLSAKDGSKETVLALLGMLSGSVVLRYVHTAQATYVVLFGLIFCHLAANFIAVRVIAMRAFNRQRAGIAWCEFRRSFDVVTVVPDYLHVARQERIFTDSARIPISQHARGTYAHCALGVSFLSLSGREPFSDEQIATLLEVFAHEKYILWPASNPPQIAVVLKDGHGPHDHLKAWAHAHEIANICDRESHAHGFNECLVAIRYALENVSRMFPLFLRAAQEVGWKTEEGVVVGGSPITVTIGEAEVLEDKKDI